MKPKILCVLNVFMNYEHIVECFESIYQDGIDYFILENKSENSDKILEYFKTKRLVGYLQSEENVTYGTVNFFMKNYKELIDSYDYLTISDGDIKVFNVDSMYNEMFNILNDSIVKVCCVKIVKDNLPNIPGSSSWVPNGEIVDNRYIKSISGTFMMTFKKENFFIPQNIELFFDTHIHKYVKEVGGISAITLINESKHLTWDYYYDGNPYYEWKKNNQWVLTAHRKETKFNQVI